MSRCSVSPPGRCPTRSAVPELDVGVAGYHLAEMTSMATDEADLIAALRARDEVAFAALVDQPTPAMLRVARGYVASHEIAEEVVQERSEERRVGKECVSTCRSRGSPEH